jgi:hypothetical protein
MAFDKKGEALFANFAGVRYAIKAQRGVEQSGSSSGS